MRKVKVCVRCCDVIMMKKVDVVVVGCVCVVVVHKKVWLWCENIYIICIQSNKRENYTAEYVINFKTNSVFFSQKLRTGLVKRTVVVVDVDQSLLDY